MCIKLVNYYDKYWRAVNFSVLTKLMHCIVISHVPESELVYGTYFNNLIIKICKFVTILLRVSDYSGHFKVDMCVRIQHNLPELLLSLITSPLNMTIVGQTMQEECQYTIVFLPLRNSLNKHWDVYTQKFKLMFQFFIAPFGSACRQIQNIVLYGFMCTWYVFKDVHVFIHMFTTQTNLLRALLMNKDVCFLQSIKGTSKPEVLYFEFNYVYLKRHQQNSVSLAWTSA